MRLRAVTRIRIRSIVVLAVAGLTLVAAGLSAVAIALPETALGRLAPFSKASEGRADAAMAAARPDDAAIARDTHRTLTLEPGSASAWLRVAWLADRRGDQKAAFEAVERSYTVAPFGPDVTDFRLTFLFNRWGKITPSLRRQALAELKAAAVARPPQIRRVQAQVQDPAGRMALTLSLPS